MNGYPSKFLYNGLKKTIPQLSRICGIEQKCLYQRLVIRKWPVDKAICTPMGFRSVRIATQVSNGIEDYHFLMRRFFTKEHRKRCQQQLKKDFEEIEQQRQHLKVA